MNYDALFARRGARRLRVGLAGAGEFGRSFLFRSGRARGVEVVAVAERDPVKAAALVDKGIEIVSDAAQLSGLDLDLIVEATGEPEAAATLAEAAIGNGKHFAMVTKEADCVVGPILQAKAEAAGLVCTPVDGDQPSLLVGLVSWARALGLEIVCAGKAGEYDVVYRPKQHGPQAWTDPACRPQVFKDALRATVPDYCELAIVANATGLGADVPQLHAPIARTVELANIFRPRGDGGVLESCGVVDMFACLRREDELSFAGGVFVVVRCDDRASWELLRRKGIPVSDEGGYALLHNPVHLLGIEAPLSLLAAVHLGAPTARLRPLWDMHARATRLLGAGTVLRIGERHAIPGVETFLAQAQPVRAHAPVPYYMAAGCTLTQPIEPGAVLTRDKLEPPAGSALWRLRAEQDERFPAA